MVSLSSTILYPKVGEVRLGFARTPFQILGSGSTQGFKTLTIATNGAYDREGLLELAEYAAGLAAALR